MKRTSKMTDQIENDLLDSKKQDQKSDAVTIRKQRSKLWSAFYEDEKQFYAWLCKNAITLLDINASSDMYDVEGQPVPFGYSMQIMKVGIRYRPPRFIRKIITFRALELFDECKERHNVLTELYDKAVSFMNEDSKKPRYPNRFPVFYERVAQINHSQDDAYSARILPDEGQFTLYSGSVDAELNEDVHSAFKAHGFNSVETTYDKFGELMTIRVAIDELRQYLECSDDSRVHVRHFTGSQYTCRISFDSGESKAVRSKFGLIVVHPDDCPSIYATPPRKKRADKLELTARQVEMPVDLGFRVFVTEG